MLFTTDIFCGGHRKLKYSVTEIGSSGIISTGYKHR